MTLTFTRQYHVNRPIYLARDDTREYRIRQHNRRWTLHVIPLATTAGVNHTIGQAVEITESGNPTKSYTVDLANAYARRITAPEYTQNTRRCMADAMDDVNKAIIDAYDHGTTRPA